MFGSLTFVKLGCLVKQTKIFNFFTTQNLGAVVADLFYLCWDYLKMCQMSSKAGAKQHFRNVKET